VQNGETDRDAICDVNSCEPCFRKKTCRLSICRSVGLSERCTAAKRLIGSGCCLGGEVGRGMGVVDALRSSKGKGSFGV